MRDLFVIVMLTVLLAGLMTTEAYVLVGLLSRGRRWRALSGLLFPPLAPVWAWKHGMRRRAMLWIVLATTYVTLLTLVLLEG